MGMTKSDLDREVLAIGKDSIPANCPGTCELIASFPGDIIVYGRRVMCRQKRAAHFTIHDRGPARISLADALESSREEIKVCDAIIQDALHRKERAEADAKVLEDCKMVM